MSCVGARCLALICAVHVHGQLRQEKLTEIHTCYEYKFSHFSDLYYKVVSCLRFPPRALVCFRPRALVCMSTRGGGMWLGAAHVCLSVSYSVS